MKWTIEGFSQSEALNFQKEVLDEKTGKSKVIKIDCNDLIILRWFVDFYPKMMKVEVDGVQYAWISYKDLLDDMPLLNIGKQMLAVRLKKLCDFGILKHQTIKRGGTFSYYGFGENYNKLIEKEGNNEREGSIKNYIGVYKKLDTPIKKIIEQINPSTKDNSSIYLLYIDEFSELWFDYPKKQGKAQAQKAYIKAREKGVTVEQVKKGISNYYKYIRQNKIEMRFVKQGSTWFRGECWNDDYGVKKSDASYNIEELMKIK